MESAAGKAVGVEALFPKDETSVPCVIHGGGPGLRVHGSCSSKVTSTADGTGIVRFAETWDGRNFRGPGSPATPGRSHTWEFDLNHANKVLRSRSFGDFPPQSVK
jgi:hypothetical protein